MQGGSLVCFGCGAENPRHALNLELEYEDLHRNKLAKMKVTAVKDKSLPHQNLGGFGSPNK
jgi:hypothetical protein